MVRAAVLLLVLVTPMLARAQAYVPPDPALVAYESSLRTRLGWLGQQVYAIRNDEETRRCRRWKILGSVFGGLGLAGTAVGLQYWALRSTHDQPLSAREQLAIGGVVGGMAAGALTGLGFVIAARFTNPHRDTYRQVRIEQKQIRRELKRLRSASYAANGFTLTF
jgi:hypothetical protein